MKTAIAFVSALAITASLGCKKDEDGGKPAASAKPASLETIELPKLALTAELPSGTKIGDGIVGDGHLLEAPGLVVSVDVASEMRPKTIAEAKEEADMYSPKNIQTEELADGWVLTFENKGAMGTNYFVNVRREIGGKSIWCETTAGEKAFMDSALRTCKSLGAK